jgi:hypothetical protein
VIKEESFPLFFLVGGKAKMKEGRGFDRVIRAVDQQGQK